MGFLEKLNAEFFLRLLVDLACVFAVVRLIYYRNYRKSDILFTYFLFNVIIFILTYLMNKVDISMGAAFGLFAVFSMLRYRTEDISAKDMTYLFIVIAIGLISAIARESYVELVLLNLLLIGLTYVLDGGLIFRNEREKTIENLEIHLIKPENRANLLAMLKESTGFNVHRIVVTRIDLTKNRAVIKAYYYESEL